MLILFLFLFFLIPINTQTYSIINHISESLKSIFKKNEQKNILCQNDIGMQYCKKLEERALKKINIAFDLRPSEINFLTYSIDLIRVFFKETYLQRKKADYYHDNKIPKRLKEIIYKQLIKNNIEPTSINIITKYGSKNYYAYVFIEHDKTINLTLSMTNLNQLNTETIEVIINHEISHLIHADQLIDEFLNNDFLPMVMKNRQSIIFDKKEKNILPHEKKQDAINNFLRMEEYRADLFFASQNHDTKNNTYNKLIMALHDTPFDTEDLKYPSLQERFKAFLLMEKNCFKR